MVLELLHGLGLRFEVELAEVSSVGLSLVGHERAVQLAARLHPHRLDGVDELVAVRSLEATPVTEDVIRQKIAHGSLGVQYSVTTMNEAQMMQSMNIIDDPVASSWGR